MTGQTERRLKPRLGYTSIPNIVLQDERLTAKHLAALVHLRSHAPKFVVRRKDLMRQLKVSEPTLDAVLRDLEEWKYLSKETARREGKVIGLFVQVFWPMVPPQLPKRDQQTEPKKAGPSDSGLIKKTNHEEWRSTFEVVENSDFGPSPCDRPPQHPGRRLM